MRLIACVELKPVPILIRRRAARRAESTLTTVVHRGGEGCCKTRARDVSGDGLRLRLHARAAQFGQEFEQPRFDHCEFIQRPLCMRWERFSKGGRGAG